MKTVYDGLFEDEVAELLRENPTASIECGNYKYYPSAMICEDGIYTSGRNYYSEYYLGKRTFNHIHMSGLINRILPHKEFILHTKGE